jgi:hypothetical protein
MKVVIYVKSDEYMLGQGFPRVLTEKQYQEKIEDLVADRLANLVDDDGFGDTLALDYSINQVFFMTEDEKKKILEAFKPYAEDSAKDELEDYYERFEIEI